MIGSLFRRQNKGRRVLDELPGFGTLVGSNTCISGEFEGTDNCVVNGVVEGNCNLDGVLLLSEGGRWNGSITAQNAVVSGTIEGDITIHMKLELTPTARIYGTISSAMIAIASGAIHEGEMHIEKGSDVIRFEEKRVSPEP